MAVLSLVVLQYYSIHYNRLVAVLSLYVLQYYIRTVFYYLRHSKILNRAAISC